MVPRRSLLVGAGATVAAGIAVAMSFAVSNAASLNDEPGEPIAVAAIVVPAPPASPTPVPTVRPTPKAAPTPETVPAPEPRDVTTEPQPEAPAEPVTPVEPAPSQSAPPSEGPTFEEVERVARTYAARNDWDGFVSWVKEQNWDAATRDRLAQELAKKYPGFDWGYLSAQSDASARDLPGSPYGSKNDRSRHAPGGD